MPKIKMPRSSPSLDMTPMVDLAFLLVTFFMLTAQFRPEEAVSVDTPSSMSQQPIPTENLMIISVDSAGRVFWDFTDKKVRTEVIKEMANRYKFQLTEEQAVRFTNLNAIGIPAQQLPAYLLDWIRVTQLIFSSEAGRNPLVALKGDGNVNYTTVNRIIEIFQSPTVKINRFKMITDLEESRI
jgi:biopolymer transport protein ExbD